MTNAFRWLWAEPRAPHPPARVWRDWVLVAALLTAALLENAVRPDLPWRPVTVVEVGVLAFALLRRRTHPFAMVAVGFGTVIVVDLASLLADVAGPVSPYSMAFLLVLPYALLRWGSGRDAVVGMAIAFVAAGIGMVSDPTGLAEAAIGLLILTFPAVLGASVRFWSTSRVRELDQVRMREREQLARELHDTVAHHVSAMVISAQAGRVVAATRPDAALEALAIIEAEGSRTLDEMRTMVGTLRERDDVDLAPGRGVADVVRLARSAGDEPMIDVHLSGELDDLSPSVGAAVYRIAQESVTNALRHARHATRITIDVASEGDSVRVTVRDDGDPTSAALAFDGYGLVGMTERATLLGGTLEWGPSSGRGWVVCAVLPRAGSAA